MQAANIVIVEDEFLVALQLEDIILELDHHVVATVPDLASAHCITQRAEIALVDINLRDGPTGPEIAHLLCERFGTRIIYVTANSGQIGIPAETALGVVHKPFSCEAIRRAITYALDDGFSVPRPRELEPLQGVRQTA